MASSHNAGVGPSAVGPASLAGAGRQTDLATGSRSRGANTQLLGNGRRRGPRCRCQNQLGSQHQARARVLAKQGRTAKAIADYETYVALAPDTANAYQELEALCRQAGLAEKAAAAHTKFIALEAEKPEAERDPSFLDQLWLARVREGLEQAP